MSDEISNLIHYKVKTSNYLHHVKEKFHSRRWYIQMVAREVLDLSNARTAFSEPILCSVILCMMGPAWRTTSRSPVE